MLVTHFESRVMITVVEVSFITVSGVNMNKGVEKVGMTDNSQQDHEQESLDGKRVQELYSNTISVTKQHIPTREKTPKHFPMRHSDMHDRLQRT